MEIMKANYLVFKTYYEDRLIEEDMIDKVRNISEELDTKDEIVSIKGMKKEYINLHEEYNMIKNIIDDTLGIIFKIDNNTSPDMFMYISHLNELDYCACLTSDNIMSIKRYESGNKIILVFKIDTESG